MKCETLVYPYDWQVCYCQGQPCFKLQTSKPCFFAGLQSSWEDCFNHAVFHFRSYISSIIHKKSFHNDCILSLKFSDIKIYYRPAHTWWSGKHASYVLFLLLHLWTVGKHTRFYHQKKLDQRKFGLRPPSEFNQINQLELNRWRQLVERRCWLKRGIKKGTARLLVKIFFVFCTFLLLYFLYICIFQFNFLLLFAPGG